MAVEPPHMNFFSPQSQINHRDITKFNQQFYNAPMNGAIPMPMSSTIPESFFPFHQPTFCEPISINKADSSVTYHIPDSRKRFRDSTEESYTLPLPQKIKLSSQPSFVDQNLLYHFQNQQSEIDLFIAQHTERVRMEIEEQRMKQSRMLQAAIQEAVAKKLKQKEEEIQRMEKQNIMLQEKAKTLIMENQIWREMALTNESAVNTLRNELEQVLAHVENHRNDEDAASSCGSNHHVKEEVVVVVEEASTSAVVGKMCSGCGVRESVVLLLPCRHLCLCTMCGTHIRSCPLCLSGINASVHVNFS